MKELLKANWKTIGGVLLVTGIYVAAKFFPDASLEQQWLQNVAVVLGLGGMLGLPAIKKPGDDA